MTSEARHRTLSAFIKVLAPASVLATLAACGPTLPQPSSTYQTANRLVFPVVAAGPNAIDGQSNEAAWGTGFRFVMEDGGSLPAAAFRGVADADAIYMHLKVDDANFDDTDVVVIGLNPDNTDGNYRRIHVFPCKPTGVCAATANGQTPSVDYFTGTLAGGTYTWSAASAATAGITAATRTVTDPVNESIKSWEIEVRVPRAAPFSFVNTNFFGLFVDVVRTDPFAGVAGEAVQYSWPPNKFIGSTSENDVLAELETGTLAPSHWGNATLNGGFGNGVRVGELRSNHPTDPNKIRLDAPNQFFATAANNTSSGGTLVGAEDIVATFTIANNGLPALGHFANVPVGGNPTASTDVAPATAHTFNTAMWTLTPQQVTDYTNNPGQCIRVELTSSNVNTVFVNATTMRNMQFVESSSPFRERAVIPTKGFEPRANERELAFTLRETFVNFDPSLPWTTQIENATPVPDRRYVYRTRAVPGADHVLGITVEPPRMTIPSEALRIEPGTGGGERPPVRFAVRPDELLTFIGSGVIDIEGQRVSAAGQVVGDRRGEQRLKGAAISRIGAVIGSFDEFKESAFLIGNTSTIKVPQGASVLHVKINDAADQYANHKGEGFTFQVVRTRVEPWMVANDPDLGRAVRGDDVFVTLGANLPTWMMRGERDTGRFIRIGGSSFRVYESVGSFGYIVRLIK